MDEQIKKSLKRAVEKGQISLTRSLLRWKYKKVGNQIPVDHQLEKEARETADRMRQVISKRGKNIWNELKKSYVKDNEK
jgi:hypothetical protein